MASFDTSEANLGPDGGPPWKQVDVVAWLVRLIRGFRLNRS